MHHTHSTVSLAFNLMCAAVVLCMQAAKRQAEADLLEGSAHFYVELGDLMSHIQEMREMVAVAQVRVLHVATNMSTSVTSSSMPL